MAHIRVRHPAGDLRSSKSAILPIFHRPAGGTGAEAERPSDPFPWGICAQQPLPRAGDPGGALRIIARIEDHEVIERILAHLDQKTTESPGWPPPCRAPPQRGWFD